jgi:hypothetical protein
MRRRIARLIVTTGLRIVVYGLRLGNPSIPSHKVRRWLIAAIDHGLAHLSETVDEADHPLT